MRDCRQSSVRSGHVAINDVTAPAVLAWTAKSHEGRGGVAHRSTQVLADRASRMCARGRVSREISEVADPDPPTFARGRHRWPTWRDERERGHQRHRTRKDPGLAPGARESRGCGSAILRRPATRQPGSGRDRGAWALRPDRLGLRRLGSAWSSGPGGSHARAVSAAAASVAPSPSAALRASAAFRSALVYWLQWVLHIRPKPSFWLGWAGKSVTGASCASIPNFADPMHLRMSAMSLVLSLANADLALRRTSITPVARRCKAEDRAARR